jgi:hypothetical protein
MQFKTCAVCGLSLPLSVMRPVNVRHNGKIITIDICDRCREIKEKEVKEKNANS